MMSTLPGLGVSEMSTFFAIHSLDEARAYLAHPVLGSRLLECASALLQVSDRTAHDIFGSPDDLKLRSSATLFAATAPPNSPFQEILDRYFEGRHDSATVQLLAATR